MLARELGKTVNELLDDLGEGELNLWYQIHKRQPLGNPWYQTGLICATVANFNAWGVKKTLKPDDFLPRLREAEKPEALHRKFLAVLACLGITPVRKDAA